MPRRHPSHKKINKPQLRDQQWIQAQTWRVPVEGLALQRPRLRSLAGVMLHTVAGGSVNWWGSSRKRTRDTELPVTPINRLSKRFAHLGGPCGPPTQVSTATAGLIRGNLDWLHARSDEGDWQGEQRERRQNYDHPSNRAGGGNDCRSRDRGQSSQDVGEVVGQG